MVLTDTPHFSAHSAFVIGPQAQSRNSSGGFTRPLLGTLNGAIGQAVPSGLHSGSLQFKQISLSRISFGVSLWIGLSTDASRISHGLCADGIVLFFPRGAGISPPPFFNGCPSRLHKYPSYPAHQIGIKLGLDTVHRSLRSGPSPWESNGPTRGKGDDVVLHVKPSIICMMRCRLPLQLRGHPTCYVCRS